MNTATIPIVRHAKCANCNEYLGVVCAWVDKLHLGRDGRYYCGAAHGCVKPEPRTP